MPNVWAVIGQGNARKSSTIRALTGVGNTRHLPPAGATPPLWDVSFVGGPVQTYVFALALQEIHITSADFIQMVNASGAHEVIVALRYTNAVYGGAMAYLTAFQTAGWNIAGYAVLGPNNPGIGFGGGIHIPGNMTTPSNAIAGQLRSAWGII